MDSKRTQEYEINLLDFLLFILSKWYFIVIAIVIGAVIGGGIYFVKSNNQVTTASGDVVEQEVIDFSDMTIDEICVEKGIDPTRITTLEAAYQIHQKYEELQKYSSKSLLMNLDASNLWISSVEYYVNGPSDAYEIIADFRAVCSNSTMLSEIMEEVSDENEYVLDSSIVTFVCDGNLLQDNSDMYKSSVRLICYMPTEETSRNAMTVTKKYTDEIVKKYIEDERYIIKNISNSYYNASNNDILLKQKTIVDSMTSWANSAKALEANLTEDELQVYELAYLSKLYDIDPDKYDGEATVELDLENQPKPISPKKYLVIGLLGAIVVLLIIEFLYYILSGSIKTADEVTIMFAMTKIGALENRNKKACPLAAISRRNGNTPNTTLYLQTLINSMDSENTLLMGDVNNTVVSEYMTEISADSNCSAINSICYDQEAIKQVDEKSGVILVVQLYKTLRSDIEKNLEICRLKSANVLGYIVIEK